MTDTCSKRSWVTLLSDLGEKNGYLNGILTLNYTLIKVKTRYPLLVIYTSKCQATALSILEKSGIKTKYVEMLQPSITLNYGTDTKRFNECFNKLRVFELFEYERVVFIDSDMIFMKNADELFDIPLDRGFIACAHACVCNPRKKRHYPKEWVSSNCAYTAQQNLHSGSLISCSYGIKMLNSGLVVLNPNPEEFAIILDHVRNCEKYPLSMLNFAEQSLLSCLYEEKWMPLPYIYNALKTLRTVHEKLWNDDDVKILHYILDKPWHDENESLNSQDPTHAWWWTLEKERLEKETNSIIYK
ncbi:hypothetical protein PNEG_03138 [Pneumocystis murina B123]|uniref:Glycosyl transferase family 8 C-terminal domain-containing protein n=1 Tax=Pneumocystis murina (strain B123) TaxID=1069680 RepID=M7NIB3_PNEMU|nr:hypothetical protein PNEG_03138 [Pneumocystis murina B123]EMR08293.1 hypothetical protein PNEG_03138 [Pneumocystis murina B123]